MPSADNKCRICPQACCWSCEPFSPLKGAQEASGAEIPEKKWGKNHKTSLPGPTPEIREKPFFLNLASFRKPGNKILHFVF